jgi:glycosyltransferase involved in cell wall biosynthesis
MSTANPIVSVIMPCYNQGQYLDEAVESVLNQTYQSFEIIVINDGSTDEKTVQILHRYEHPKVKIIHTENQGPSAARNTGIKQSCGKYILPLDSDDRIEPTYLERAVNILEKNSAIGIVYCEAEYFGDIVGRWDLPEYKFPEILLDNVIFNSSMYRRDDWETVGGYSQNMIHGWEDYDFWLSLIELKHEVFRIPEVLFYYRQISISRDHQMTMNKFLDSYGQIYRNHLQLYSENIEILFQRILERNDELNSLRLSYGDLQPKLEQTQQRLGQTQQELRQTQQELRQTQQELGQTQQELGQTQQELGQTQLELNRSRAQVEAMQTSKFWKLRSAWFQVKRTIGLPVENDR